MKEKTKIQITSNIFVSVFVSKYEKKSNFEKMGCNSHFI